MDDEQARRYVDALNAMKVDNPVAYDLVMKALSNYLESQLEIMQGAEAAYRAMGEFSKADELQLRILDMEMVRDGDMPPPFTLPWNDGPFT